MRGIMDWKTLGIDATDDIEAINAAFMKRTAQIHPDRDSSQFRVLFFAYKDAIRAAYKALAIKGGKRSEDVNFNFNDDRYLEEFMTILECFVDSGLSSAGYVAAWRFLFEDSDYRILQRTDSFLERFDAYMSHCTVDKEIWRYLLGHFNVYGPTIQKKKLLADLKQYGNIRDDLVTAFVETDGKKKSTKQADSRKKRPTTVQPMAVPAMENQPKTLPSLQPDAQRDIILEKYLAIQNLDIVMNLSSEFLTKFDRVYSHDVSKNNLGAWRYLFQNQNYTLLLRQAKFTELLADRMCRTEDLYPAVWQYIIDKTRVPESHQDYGKTTGRMIAYSKGHSFRGNIRPQLSLPADTLRKIIDEDNYQERANTVPVYNHPVRKAKKSSNGVTWVIVAIAILFWLFRFLL